MFKAKSFFIVVVLLLMRMAWAEDVPFQAEPGLFDSNNVETLGLKTIRANHTELYRATENGYKFCHHPNLVVFRDELFCMWSNGLVGEDQPGQRILYCRSKDGKTWSKPIVLTDDKNGKGICVAAGFVVLPGTPDQLVALYTATGGSNFHPETALMSRTSIDGKVWSQPLRITSGFFIEGPHRTLRGNLLMGGEQVGDARKTKRTRFLMTDDSKRLARWKEIEIETPDLKTFGYTEPSFFRQRDKTLVASLRNYSGFLFATTSRDEGKTWSTPVQTNFPDSTARTSAGNLPVGTPYIINNPMPKRLDRSLLTIALSRDGKVFDRAYILRGEPTKKRFEGKSKLDGWQYPNAIAWRDWLLVAYSINKEDVAISRILLSDLRR